MVYSKVLQDVMILGSYVQSQPGSQNGVRQHRTHKTQKQGQICPDTAPAHPIPDHFLLMDYSLMSLVTVVYVPRGWLCGAPWSKPWVTSHCSSLHI